MHFFFDSIQITNTHLTSGAIITFLNSWVTSLSSTINSKIANTNRAFKRTFMEIAFGYLLIHNCVSKYYCNTFHNMPIQAFPLLGHQILKSWKISCNIEKIANVLKNFSSFSCSLSISRKILWIPQRSIYCAAMRSPATSILTLLYSFILFKWIKIV